MERRWTCVRTQPQAERWAERNLQRSGYQTFLPLVTVKRRDRAVKTLWHQVQTPLFANYLFVQHDPADSWTPIRETPGVKSLLKCGAQLAYTSDMAVRALRGVLDGAEAFSASGIPRRRSRAPGDAVTVSTGVFAGHPGVVLQVGSDKVLISLLLFGALREALVAADNLVEREP